MCSDEWKTVLQPDRPFHYAIWAGFGRNPDGFVFLPSTVTTSWIVAEDWGRGHVDAAEWPEPKSVRFIPHQSDCRTAYL